MWKQKKNRETLRFLPPERIIPASWQNRREFNSEGLAKLAQSIARYGMIEPLVVRERGEDFELILGERRLRAARLLGQDTVPCRVMDISARTGAEMALIENLVREDLNLFEEAQAIDRLMRHFQYSQSDLASRIGQSQSTVANKLRLLRLGPEERILICENRLTERHARALIRIQDPETRLFALKYLIEKGYNVRQTDSFVEALLENPDEFMISLQPKKCRPRPVRRLVVKDVRLFCNSVDRAIVGIREAGIDLVAEKEEGDSFISYSIRIPKYAKHPVA